jgi:hypothetical protein
MVVGVDLDGRELTLVDNILVGQGTQVEPVLEADGVGSAFSKDIELSLE